MERKETILIWGQNRECEEAILLLENYFKNTKKIFSYITSENYEELYQQVVDADPKIVIVFAQGAYGMECVYQAKKYNEDIIVFWFSDDCHFSIQSHRMECAYFAVKPLTAEKLNKAFQRCRNFGIYC